MKIKKIALVIVGCIGVGLGAVGAVVPMLPAFPFLMLAAVRGRTDKPRFFQIKQNKANSVP